MTEEARAAEWRAKQARRAQFLRDNERRLRGSPSRRAQLEANWAAIVNRTQPEDTR